MEKNEVKKQASEEDVTQEINLVPIELDASKSEVSTAPVTVPKPIAQEQKPAQPKPKREKYAYQNRSNKPIRTARLEFNQDTIVTQQSKPHNGIIAKLVLQNTAPPGLPPRYVPPNPIYGRLINPSKLGLLPSNEFKTKTQMIDLHDFKVKYFECHSTKTYRFEHKLYNALKITKDQPSLIQVIGVWWKTTDIFIVNIPTFGALLGSQSPRAYLCHSSGIFAKHGFNDVTAEVQNKYSEELKDCNNIAYTHSSGKFTDSMTESDLDEYCKYVDSIDEKIQREPPLPQISAESISQDQK